MSVVPLNRRQVLRYRLQFMAEELDLPLAGTAILGRSKSCDVTIFDPLVSREHARIILGREQAFIEDLSSHNGTQVNGTPIRGRCAIRPGDRIRLGRSECVFKEAPEPPAREETTCSLVYCAACELVYPKEAGACPHCGSTDTVERVSRSGVYDGPSRGRWAVEMLIELSSRLVCMGATKRAGEYFEQALDQAEEETRAGTRVEAAALGQIVELAQRLSQALDNPGWPLRAQRLQQPGSTAKRECG